MVADSQEFSLHFGDLLASRGSAGPSSILPANEISGISPNLNARVSPVVGVPTAAQLDSSEVAALMEMATIATYRIGLQPSDIAEMELRTSVPLFGGAANNEPQGDDVDAGPSIFTFCWRGMEWDFHMVDGAMEFAPLEEYAFHNPNAPVDINDDGFLAPIDALLVINQLNSLRGTILPNRAPESMNGMMLDVTGDRWVTPQDALLVINGLNSSGAGPSGRRLVAVDDDFMQSVPTNSTSFPVSVIDVMSNDFYAGRIRGVWSVLERPGAQLVSVGPASYGEVRIVQDPSTPGYSYVEYTPGESLAISDSFTYVIADAAGNRAVATVNVYYHVETPPRPALTISAPAEIRGSVPGAPFEFRGETGEAFVTIGYTGENPAIDVVVFLSFSMPQTSNGVAVIGSLSSRVTDTAVTLTPIPWVGLWVTGPMDQVNAALAGLRFDPAPGFSAPDGLLLGIYVYETETPDGIPVNAYAQTTLFVPSDEQAPITIDDSAVISSFTEPIRLDVLANDRSPAGSPLRLVALATTAVNLANSIETSFGTLRIDSDANQLVFTPNTIFHGADSFVYVTEDAEGRLSQGFGMIVGNHVSTPRVGEARNDHFSATFPMGTERFPAVDIDVLGNDFPGDDILFDGLIDGSDPSVSQDPDAVIAPSILNDVGVSRGALRLISVSSPSFGSAEVVDGDSSFGRQIVRYTPDDRFSGTDSFTYVVEDVAGNRSEATVFVSLSVEFGPSANIVISMPQSVGSVAPSGNIDFVDADGAGLISVAYEGESPSVVRVFLELYSDSPYGFAVPGRLTSSTAEPEVWMASRDTTVMLSGTLEQVNANLAGLRYEASPGFSSPDGTFLLIWVSVNGPDESNPEFNYRYLPMIVTGDPMAPRTTTDQIEVPQTWKKY
ncbi:MAG: Ig-like domain-containing protein [Planctomycetota bacterium]